MEDATTDRRGSRRRSWGLVLVLLGTAACGRAVTVNAPTGAPTEACEALAAQLPDRLRGQARLAVTPATGTTAAWGSPAIVWRCGVPRPASVRPTSQLVTVNGVAWYPETLSEGFRFTSVETDPRVELSVPAAHPNAAELLTVLPVPPASQPG